MSRAPSRLSAVTASAMVPAVSIMSSGMSTSRSATSPTTFRTSATLADGRRLPLQARDALGRLNDRGDPRRAGPPGGVHEEQELDHVLGRGVGRLDDVDVPAAHVLVDLDEQLTVGEPAERDLAEGLAQVGGHLFGQGTVGRAAQE